MRELADSRNRKTILLLVRYWLNAFIICSGTGSAHSSQRRYKMSCAFYECLLLTV